LGKGTGEEVALKGKDQIWDGRGEGSFEERLRDMDMTEKCLENQGRSWSWS